MRTLGINLSQLSVSGKSLALQDRSLEFAVAPSYQSKSFPFLCLIEFVENLYKDFSILYLFLIVLTQENLLSRVFVFFLSFYLRRRYLF